MRTRQQTALLPWEGGNRQGYRSIKIINHREEQKKMRKRRESSPVNARLLTIKQAAERLQLGETLTRKFAEECGAVTRIGSAVRIDRLKLDRALDAQSTEK